jgi:hypothetical protein
MGAVEAARAWVNKTPLGTGTRSQYTSGAER